MNARLAASAPEPELVLEYELFDMPTAQHKAGLAGLILHLKNLEKREVTPRPRIESVAPQSARFRFTQRDFQTLFDDLYDGYWTEARVRQKYQNKDPKRIEEVKSVEGKKTEKWFIYDEFRPRGSVLGFYLQEATNSPWLKLWQDMLWSVLRAQPTTRGEYQRRADGDSVSFADELWGKLVKSQTQKNRLVTTSIAGSLFVGAQDQNAEQVPFQGRIEHNLLLHFWTWVTPIFVPQVVNLKDKQREYQGYLLAIPEVADLEEFIEAVTEFWQSLSPDISGYRPRGALIDLPEEGGLEFLYS
ncbi:MAG: type I-MYXAN CRISPR-associated protein Cmx8 [Gammaproteobacteria bacterium]